MLRKRRKQHVAIPEHALEGNSDGMPLAAHAAGPPLILLQSPCQDDNKLSAQ